MEKTFSAERLRELLHYDPATGVFTRLVRTSNRIKVGDVAGSANSEGYIRICVEGSEYYAHRLAWLYTTGLWPKEQIDHINGVRDDNKWSNLREATVAQNQQNLRKARNGNKCGLLGVSEHYGRWRAKIKVNGSQINIGTFDTPIDAHEAYIAYKYAIHPFQTFSL